MYTYIETLQYMYIMSALGLCGSFFPEPPSNTTRTPRRRSRGSQHSARDHHGTRWCCLTYLQIVWSLELLVDSLCQCMLVDVKRVSTPAVWSQCSSVSIVSGYGLEDRALEVRSPAEARGFSSNLCVQTSSEAHSASCPMGTGAKLRPGRDADYSPPSSTEVKNE
jgi:hypothetical protein